MNIAKPGYFSLSVKTCRFTLGFNKDVLKLKINSYQELLLLAIYWCFYSITTPTLPPTPPKKRPVEQTHLPPLLSILLFLTVHHKGIIPLLNLIYSVLHFLPKGPHGQKNTSCIEPVCCWPEMVLCSVCLFSFPAHIFQITHRFMNMILTLNFVRLESSFKWGLFSAVAACIMV